MQLVLPEKGTEEAGGKIQRLQCRAALEKAQTRPHFVSRDPSAFHSKNTAAELGLENPFAFGCSLVSCLCALAGRYPSPHAVQGHGEGQALCAVVLQEGAGLQQVRDPPWCCCSLGSKCCWMRDSGVRGSRVRSWRSWGKFALPGLKFGFHGRVDTGKKYLWFVSVTLNTDSAALDQTPPHLFSLKTWVPQLLNLSHV